MQKYLQTIVGSVCFLTLFSTTTLLQIYFSVAGFFTSFFLGGGFGASTADFSTFWAVLEAGADGSFFLRNCSALSSGGVSRISCSAFKSEEGPPITSFFSGLSGGVFGGVASVIVGVLGAYYLRKVF